MGKSYGVVEWAEESGNDLSIFTARRELYGQYIDWCEDRDLDYFELPAFQYDCETMGNDHAIEGKVDEIYERGITGQEIHENSVRYFGQQLPCQKDGECRYIEQREFDPEKFDVLIGHYLQAHNQDYIKDRFVAFDEFPGDAYFFEPTHNEATQAISNYLKETDDLPFRSWKDLRRHGYDDEHKDAVKQWKDDMGFYSDRDTRYALQQKPGFHALAPLLTYAGLEFELIENDWEYAKLGLGRVAVLSPEDEWTVLIPPLLNAEQRV